jgi:septal ring factor EnvC (AmiA/AmiB activator)
VLALAAGIVGVVLGVSAKDESATKDEVRVLRHQVESVQQQAVRATQEDIASLTDRVDGLEGRINSIADDQRTSQRELSVVRDDIDELRRKISDLERSAAPGGAAGGAFGGGGRGNP